MPTPYRPAQIPTPNRKTERTPAIRPSVRPRTTRESHRHGPPGAILEARGLPGDREDEEGDDQDQRGAPGEEPGGDRQVLLPHQGVRRRHCRGEQGTPPQRRQGPWRRALQGGGSRVDDEGAGLDGACLLTVHEVVNLDLESRRRRRGKPDLHRLARLARLLDLVAVDVQLEVEVGGCRLASPRRPCSRWTSRGPPSTWLPLTVKGLAIRSTLSRCRHPCAGSRTGPRPQSTGPPAIRGLASSSRRAAYASSLIANSRGDGGAGRRDRPAERRLSPRCRKKTKGDDDREAQEQAEADGGAPPARRVIGPNYRWARLRRRRAGASWP